MRKIYIVTGGNGFLGNNIIRQIKLDEGDEIRVLALPNDKVNSLEGLNVKLYYGDITKDETLDEIFSSLEDAKVYVIQCAAIVSIKSKHDPKIYEVNVGGLKNIANRALSANAKMVYVSSVHALKEGNKGDLIKEVTRFEPDEIVGDYGKTKALGANMILDMVKEKGLNCSIVHPSGIIGPNDFGDSNLTEAILMAANEKLPAVVNGGYDFVDVRDVAAGVLKALYKDGNKGECYILANKYYDVKEITTLASEYSGAKVVNFSFPLWFIKMVAPLCELYYNARKQTPLFTKYSIHVMTHNSNFSHEKAIKELGYITRPMEETIKDTVDFLKAQGRIKDRK